jgi:hypothetical protein
MASFTYTIWSDLSLSALMSQLRVVFDQLGFSLTNPRSGKVHLWSDGESEIDPTALQSITNMELPLGVQWWRGDDDIYVAITKSSDVGGFICHVTLVGLSREEQAEIAKLLILHVTPEKQRFPDDFYVFRLSAQ